MRGSCNVLNIYNVYLCISLHPKIPSLFAFLLRSFTDSAIFEGCCLGSDSCVSSHFCSGPSSVFILCFLWVFSPFVSHTVCIISLFFLFGGIFLLEVDSFQWKNSFSPVVFTGVWWFQGATPKVILYSCSPPGYSVFISVTEVTVPLAVED